MVPWTKFMGKGGGVHKIKNYFRVVLKISNGGRLGGSVG